ncbi:excinuclease ABC subunit UvrC [Bogoriella caseilytica]|uniref:UvrABC system protein C n=1 Tax=Bogoriella caseilytica TaxID=56055 RepID=A0A3N2BHB6_9MICO|nr:excinuclease ABC subunit UvrC [Bogoriella caseilytica]ROR74464.1 excinuclease ABC subunit C [Bogoriella caseilytica]
MADPSTYRPKPGEIPVEPGVYRFLDGHGRVIYVGKAKSLRSRLSSYFQDLAGLHPRTQQMVTTAAKVEWTVVGTEVEALTLEYAWIKEFDPRFNIKYRDDKSYPFLAVTMGEEVPRVQVMRGSKKTGTKYYGPYTHAWAIRETVDQLLRVFPVRTCSPGVYKRAAASGRPCLLGYIDKCSAPCVGRVSPEEHRELAEQFCHFMDGETGPHMKRLEQQMRQAALDQDFERAARLRDDIGALRHVVEKNAIVLPDATDADVFGLAADELEASVQVFHVRGGRIRGQRGWVVERVEAVDEAGLVEHLLEVYDDNPTMGIPREVLVPVLPENAEAIADYLSGLRGSRVSLRVPQRGDKKAIAETVRTNAVQALALHKTRRAGDLTSRSQALAELTEAIGLTESPLRIECYDISHTQGTHQTGSMVVFEDGMPKKSDYRRFVIRGEQGEGAKTTAGATAGAAASSAASADDTAAMDEVLRRRFKRYLAEQAGIETAGVPQPDPAAADVEESDRDAGPQLDDDGVPLATGPVDPETGRARKFSYPPNLVVVDGGLPQVNAARAALDDLGVDEVAVIGLAKRLEEVWIPGEDFPVILPRTSPALYLLQQLRDESHRFAISHHRSRRGKAMTRSVLDDIPGLGATRQTALLKHFGSVKRLAQADVAEIAAVKGMGPATAQAVHDALSSREK